MVEQGQTQPSERKLVLGQDSRYGKELNTVGMMMSGEAMTQVSNTLHALVEAGKDDLALHFYNEVLRLAREYQLVAKDEVESQQVK